MANKPLEKTKFDTNKFWADLREINAHVTDLTKSPNVDRSPSLIRKYINRGEMPVKLYNSLRDRMTEIEENGGII